MEFELNIFTEKGTISIPLHFTPKKAISEEDYDGPFGLETIQLHVQKELRKALQISDEVFLGRG